MSNEVHQEVRPLRVVVIPDSFKGSATAADVAAAITAGVEHAASSRQVPVQVTSVPFADGGEGTLDALVSAWGVSAHRVATTDAIGRPITARYAISPDGVIGVVEAAEANGLPQVSDVPLQPLQATTRGVGVVLRAVLDAGVSEILLCIGGSATTDGGGGMLTELGARLLDSAGDELADGAAALLDLATVDLSGLPPRVTEVRWRVACDVTNPLLGPRGAAAVFGPQKGATPEDIVVLEEALRSLAQALTEATGVSLTQIVEEPGMGAAGGMGAAVRTVLGGELVPGAELVADILQVRDALAQADLVFTGEGRLDSQSLAGKVVDAVRRFTPAATPVVVLAGAVTADLGDLDDRGVTAFSIAPGPSSLDELRADVTTNLTRTAVAAAQLFLAGRCGAVQAPADVSAS